MILQAILHFFGNWALDSHPIPASPKLSKYWVVLILLLHITLHYHLHGYYCPVLTYLYNIQSFPSLSLCYVIPRGEWVRLGADGLIGPLIIYFGQLTQFVHKYWKEGRMESWVKKVMRMMDWQVKVFTLKIILFPSSSQAILLYKKL